VLSGGFSRNHVIHWFTWDSGGGAREVVKTRNVTLSLPEDLLRQARRIALERETSLSALLSSLLDDLVHQEAGYDAAREDHLRLLEQGLSLGTNGRAPWSREELHERG
jgi:hypothetical protein